jgi:AraC-like DNA-binding protein
MPAGVVDRPSTGDVMLLIVSPGCELRDRHGLHQIDGPGFIYWREQQAHHYGCLTDNWHHSWIHMRGSWLRRLGHFCPANTCIGLEQHHQIEATMHMIYYELQSMQPQRQILANLLENMLLWASTSLDGYDDYDVPLAFIELKQYMDNHYYLPLSLQDLAGRMSLSVSHFSNRFRHYFSCAPIDYLIRVRMEHARHLLSNQNLSITAVAESVGYEDVAYFSRLVKRYHGDNPRALRKLLLEG